MELTLIQAPRYRLGPDFLAGKLLPMLTETPPVPTPVSYRQPAGMTGMRAGLASRLPAKSI